MNIRTYSRLELLIEVLIRLNRDLKETDKFKFSETLSQYTGKTAQNQMYELKSTDVPKQIEKIAEEYLKLHAQLQAVDYECIESYGDYVRVFQEHFVLVANSLTVKENSVLTSSILQSLNAPDATFRNKSGEHHHGLEVFVNETCNPDNPLQLITDIAVYQNNVDDSAILNERIETMKDKTPNLSELHTDGWFGNNDNDLLLNELEVVQVQTAVRGRKSDVEITIVENKDSENYTESCPAHKVESTKTKKWNKVKFDLQKCSKCPLVQICKIYENKGKHYFTEDDHLTNKRKNIIYSLPLKRRKLRPNVEAVFKNQGF